MDSFKIDVASPFLLNKFSKYNLYSHSENLNFFQQQQTWNYL